MRKLSRRALYVIGIKSNCVEATCKDRGGYCENEIFWLDERAFNKGMKQKCQTMIVER
jgi:hypothetical protein